MNLRSLVIFILLGLSVIGLAQELDLTNEYRGSNGISLHYPELYVINDEVSDSVELINFDTLEGFVILMGEAARFDSSRAFDTVDDIVTGIQTLGRFMSAEMSEPTVVTFGDGRLGQVLMSSGNLPAVYVAFETPSGTLGLVQALSLAGGDVTVLEPLAVAIAGTVDYDASAVMNDEVMPSGDADAVGDDNGTVGDVEEDEDAIPEGAIALADMPENTLLFTSGGQITYDADKFRPLPELNYAQSSFTFNYGDTGDFTQLVTIIDDFSNTLEEALTGIAFVSFLTGQSDFDAETDIQTITLEDGRVLHYYYSEDADIPQEEKGFVMLMFVIEVAANHYSTIQVQTLPDFVTEDTSSVLFDDILAMASSFKIRDDLSLSITDEANTVSTIMIQEASCGDVSYSYVDSANTVAVVTCPAGCGDFSVWGTDIYTHDSSICTAAIHAGVIRVDEGGLVEVTYVEGQDEYIGTVSNGIETLSYGAWGDSFSVSVPNGE